MNDSQSLGETVMTATTSAARSSWRTLDATTNTVLADLPEPVARYALPTIAVLAITGALLALFLPPRAQASRIGSAMSYSAAGAQAHLGSLHTTRIGAGWRKASAHTRAPLKRLAASGASTTDIAWKTGLPIDAVNLLLAISTGPRQLQPPTA